MPRNARIAGRKHSQYCESHSPARALLIAAGLCLAFSLPASGADTVRGGELYQRYCASCHGQDGISTWPGAPHIARREGMLQADRALLQKLRVGRGSKPGFQGLMSDVEILSVIAYSRTLMR